ncbi:hypothetical protein ABID58_003292 [Bradyrhizobium sp. S3.2.6]
MSDLVMTAQMRHFALDVSARDPVGRLRDLGQRADHRAPHHDDIEAGENERDETEHETDRHCSASGGLKFQAVILLFGNRGDARPAEGRRQPIRFRPFLKRGPLAT